MNWPAIAAVADLLGPLAVVGSLVYLSIQVRYNSRQVEEQIRPLDAQSLNAIESSFSGFRSSMIHNR